MSFLKTMLVADDQRVDFKQFQNQWADVDDFIKRFKIKDPYKYGALNPGALTKDLPKYPLSKFEKEFVDSLTFSMQRRQKDYSISAKQYAVLKKIHDKVETYLKAVNDAIKKHGG